MKTYKILILLLTLFTLQTHAQMMIGYKVQEIRTKYSDKEIESGYTKNNVFYLNFETDIAHVVHYFNDEGFSYYGLLLPKSQSQINFYVELYNKNYVILDNTHWQMYNGNGIASIELIFDDGVAVFIWK